MSGTGYDEDDDRAGWARWAVVVGGGVLLFLLLGYSAVKVGGSSSDGTAAPLPTLTATGAAGTPPTPSTGSATGAATRPATGSATGSAPPSNRPAWHRSGPT